MVVWDGDRAGRVYDHSQLIGSIVSSGGAARHISVANFRARSQPSNDEFLMNLSFSRS